jgi:BMFP domain-containing protein YqiC
MILMLNARRQKALAALLLYPNRAEAARACGLCAKTLLGYSREPEFSAALEAAQRNALTDAAKQINATLAGAVSTLRAICENPQASEQARVAAARGLLEFALRFAETTNLESRLAALEARETEENGDVNDCFAPSA